MIKINQTKGEIIVEDKSYNFSDIVNYLTNTTHQVIADILKENKIKLLRKVRMDAMRATLRPSIVKTRSECLTLDQKLNYRLLWFNDFSEEQMSFYFEYFKSKDLNRLYANKFYRNLLIYLSNFPCHEKCLKDIIDVALESKDLLEKEIKIKEILKVYDEFFLDSKNTIDGLTIDKFRPVIYNSATKKQIERIGLKYGVNIPEKINKQTICAYVVEKLKAMGVNTDDLTSKITKMQVKDIRQYALDNGLETGSELNKKEMIEYILQRAEPTRDGYTCPESDRVYEMRIPITDEESVYEKIIIEQTRLKDELAKKDLMLNKTHGDELEKLKEEFVKKEEELAKNQAELDGMQTKYEENLTNFSENIKEEFEEINSESSKVVNKTVITSTNIERHIEKHVEKEVEIRNVENNIVNNSYSENNDVATQPNIIPAEVGHYDIANIDEKSDLIVFEPQKQDLVLYEQLETNKIHRRSMLSLFLIIFAFFLIVVLGAGVYKILTTYTLLKLDNFDLTPKNDEALSPLADKTLTVSPYSFSGDLDLRKYYTSKSSTLNFEYYEKTSETSEYTDVKYIKRISLSDVYENRYQQSRYVAKVMFKTVRKYYYVNLEFDYKNVINLKTPKGDVVASWKDYLEYPGTYKGFFEKELREKGKKILNPFTSKNDPINRDIETWFLDEKRKERFNHNRLVDIKRNNLLK